MPKLHVSEFFCRPERCTPESYALKVRAASHGVAKLEIESSVLCQKQLNTFWKTLQLYFCSVYRFGSGSGFCSGYRFALLGLVSHLTFYYLFFFFVLLFILPY